MKIGIVTEYYYPLLGGITEHVHHFAREAKRQGHEPVIITGNAGPAPFIDEDSVRIIRLGRSFPLYSNASIASMTVGFNLGRRMKEILATEKFDVVHIHSPYVPMLPALAIRYSKGKTFATFHTQFSSSLFLGIYKKLAQKTLGRLDGRIAVSELCVESMDRFVDLEFRIIPNGIDTNLFNGNHEKVEAFNDGKLNIFFLSRLEPRNGLGYLIEAFDIVNQNRNDCRLIVGGDGPLMPYYKSMVPKRSKKDIHFIGRISGVRPNYYSTADIFCFPTTRASFGITLLEAMASEKPVVAFSLPAYEKIITSGKDGVLCGDIKAENLARALNVLLDSREKREALGQNARATAKQYSWDKVTKKVINYYNESAN